MSIVTKDHRQWFGKVRSNRMNLNHIGNICKNYWMEIPEHYPEADLDLFVIMPNHVHGIIIIDQLDVQAGYAPLKRHSLGNIVGSFKSSVTQKIKKDGNANFKWGRRYHDRVIRDEKELYRIRRYIQLNPIKWDFDKNEILDISF